MRAFLRYRMRFAGTLARMKRPWLVLTVAGSGLVAVATLLRARGTGPRNANATVPYERGSRIEEIATLAREPHVKRVEKVNGRDMFPLGQAFAKAYGFAWARPTFTNTCRNYST